MNINEAFRAMNLLESEDFNLNSDSSMDDLDKFLADNDKITFDDVEITDPEADTEDDLSNSYTGKIICQCSICKSLQYKDKEAIVIDDETGLANVGDECPICMSEDGYTIVGQVAPFSEEEIEEEPTEDTEVDVETTDDVEEPKDEEDDDIDESLNEDLQQVEVKTDTHEVEVIPNEDGGVTVNTKPLEVEGEETGEVVAPLDMDTVAEIAENQPAPEDEEIPVEDEIPEEELEEEPVEEFDEDSFN